MNSAIKNQISSFLEEMAQRDHAVATALADKLFLRPNWVEVYPDSVMPLRMAVALTCSINPQFASVIEHAHGEGEGDVGAAVKLALRRLKYMKTERARSPTDPISLHEIARVAGEICWQLPAEFPLAREAFQSRQPTICEFEPIAQAREADVQATSGPAAPKGETVKDRRARLLARLEAEEKIKKYGALQRVADQERAIRPTADRSSVGKDIKLGRKERAEFLRAGALPQVTRT